MRRWVNMTIAKSRQGKNDISHLCFTNVPCNKTQRTQQQGARQMNQWNTMNNESSWLETKKFKVFVVNKDIKNKHLFLPPMHLCIFHKIVQLLTDAYIYTWCDTQEIFGGQSNIRPTLVVPSPSDGVQTPQTKFIKTCLGEIIKEPQFIITFKTITLFNLMVHSHHFSSTNILQTLMMVGHPKINDAIFLHLVD